MSVKKIGKHRYSSGLTLDVKAIGPIEKLPDPDSPGLSFPSFVLLMDGSLWVHTRMTGKLMWQPITPDPKPATKAPPPAPVKTPPAPAQHKPHKIEPRTPATDKEL